MDITPLSDGELRIPATVLLERDLPAEFTDGEGLVPVNFGGFLVRTSEHTVIVDTGVGGGAIAELPVGSFPRRLEAAGVRPEDVDTVVFTHLHFDHVGWSTDGEDAFFPRATHHAHAADWAYYYGPEPHPETGPGREDFGAIPAPQRLAPLADSIVLHQAERSEVVPGVTLRLAPGHTPGHCVVELEDRDQRAVLLADVAHSPAQLIATDNSSTIDVDPEVARDTRESLAAELTDRGTLITMTHDGGNRLGRLVGDSGGGRRWEYA